MSAVFVVHEHYASDMLPSRESFITALIQSKLSIRRLYRNWRRTNPTLSNFTSLSTPSRSQVLSEDDTFRHPLRRPAELPASSPDPNPLPLPLLLFLLFIIAFIVRVSSISYPPSVVFDEVHFLRFVRAYYYGEYFFDIHPPLGKLVFLVVTYLFCGPPEKKFATNGAEFGAQRYVPLRVTSALFGSAVSPLTYLIAREIGLSSAASLFVAFAQIFEHLAVIESRLVLMDSQLLMWMAVCLFLALRMWSRPVGKRWPLVIAVALSGSAAISVKWTALATPALIAIVSLIGTPFPSRRLSFAEMGVAATVAFSFYTAQFWLHFKLLPKTGEGAAFMLAKFRHHLVGDKLYSPKIRKPGFWRSFFYLNKTMYYANKGITQRHRWESKWWQWIINQRGLLYFSHMSDLEEEPRKFEKIYLIVNPAATLITCIGLPAFVIMAFVWLIRRWRRRIPAKKSIERRRMHACMQRGAFLLAGYVCNVLPYVGKFSTFCPTFFSDLRSLIS